MSVRLYGRAQGNSSHARVTRGFYGALRDAGMLSGFVGLDLSAISEDVQRETDELALRGAVAPYGVFTGPLGYIEQMMFHAAHRERWIMVAPNSNLLPQPLMRELSRVATGLLAPSTWAEGVLDKLFPSMRVECVPHGVTVVNEPLGQVEETLDFLRQDFRLGAFRVVHFSTSDRERKGTFELLEAWSKLMLEKRLPPDATLTLVLDYHARVRLIERVADAELQLEGVKFSDRVDLNPEVLGEFLRQYHLVCQPSRSEGFGLIPLESLCAGVPIAATDCTGHQEYMHNGVHGAVVIETGELEPIDDLEGALAPSLEPSSIEEALEAAYTYWPALALAAAEHRGELTARWDWRRQLQPFITMLQKGNP